MLALCVLLQGNLYVTTSSHLAGQGVHAGVSDGVTGDVGPAEDPTPASQASLAALDQTVQEMTERWRTLDQACDPTAVFALLYLVTTKAVRAHIQDAYFQDNGFLAAWTIAFADRYETAIDAWMTGDAGAISEPWLDAFQRAAAGQTSVSEDILLGMNVHIHYDLGLVTERLQIVEDHRKEDFDRINDVLARVARPASRAVAEHYDPSQAPSGEDDAVGPATQLLVNAWREEAWTDAEVLVNAPTQSARDAYADTLAGKTIALNAAIDATNPAPDVEAREAYCLQQNTEP